MKANKKRLISLTLASCMAFNITAITLTECLAAQTNSDTFYYSVAKNTKSIKTGIVSTNGTNLNIRSGAGTSYSKIGSLKNGSEVTIVEETSNGWYKIKFNSGYGYVSAKYIKLKNTESEEKPNTSETNTKTGVVNTAVDGYINLNVRSGAGTSYSKIGSLKNGSEVTIVEETSNGWYKIKFNSGYGYVSAKYIKLKNTESEEKPNTSETSTKTGIVTTSGTNLNVRNGAGTSYSKIGSLKNGSKVTIVEETSNGWYKIKFNNSYGYVSNSYISIIDIEEGNNDQSKYEKFLICIDPGHQSKGDLDKEPIGPGSSETKYKVSYGTQGVVTNLPEYELTLQTAKILEAYLEEMGFKVIMTRYSNDVNISNSERAIFANENNANLVIRLHADGSNDPNTNGSSILIPAKDGTYTKSIYPESSNCASMMFSTMKTAGFKVNNIYQRSDLTGFNWSTVPAVLLEMGFMTNPEEDRNLSDKTYQEKMMKAVANSIKTYFSQK